MSQKKMSYFIVALSSFSLCAMEQPPRVESKKREVQQPQIFPEMRKADKELLMAAANGNYAAAKDVLKIGADINCYDLIKATPLHYAVINGHVNVIELLLELGPQVDLKNNRDQTPLHLTKSTEIAQLLLSAGFSLEATDQNGMTPLHFVAHDGLADLVRLLLKAGANKEACASRNVRALHYAVQEGLVDVVRILLAAGCDKEALTTDEETPLHLAAGKGHDDVIKLLIGAGANVDAQQKIGATPLHYAASEGQEVAVKLLLAAGAQREIETKTGGETPLHCASRRGKEHPAIMKMLLDGANKDAQLSDGFTVLHMAAVFNQIELIKMLINAQYDMKARALTGETALHCAAAYGNDEVIKLLLSAGADLDAQSESGRTPLHCAIANQFSHENAVKLLLSAGARRELVANDGGTPLHYAAVYGCPSLVKLLLDAGCHRECMGGHNRTPLHYAGRCGDTSKGRKSVVKILLRAGCNKEAVAKDNETPLLFAVENGCLKISKLLLESGAHINASDSNHITILMIAVKKKKYKILRELLSCPNLLIDDEDDNGDRALQYACDYADQDPTALMLLLAYGAMATQEEIETALNNNLLFKAAALGDLAQLEQALQSNPSLSQLQEAFDCAAGRGHLSVITRLFRYAVDPRPAIKMVKVILQRSPTNPEIVHRCEQVLNALIKPLPLVEQITERPAVNRHLMTMITRLPVELRERIYVTREERLITEIKIGTIDAVRNALHAGADPNARDHEGTPAVLLAAQRSTDSLEGALALLMAGADPTVADDAGLCPLDWAVLYGDETLVRELIVFGAPASDDVVRQYLTGSLLQQAAALGYEDEILYLLQQSTSERHDIEQALVYAVSQGRHDMVRLLLGFGVSPRHAEAALSLILQRRGIEVTRATVYREIMKMLETAQAAPARLIPDQRLLTALKQGDVVGVKDALNGHADPDVHDSEGRTALALAASYAEETIAQEMVRLLLNEGANPDVMVDAKAKLTLLKSLGHRPQIVIMLAQALQHRKNVDADLAAGRLTPGLKRTADQAFL
jgi:ankyrin repeat protein